MPPINDDWANATAIAGASGSVTGTNVGATLEGAEPGVDTPPDGVSGAATVWWSWTAPSADPVVFDTFGSRIGTDTLDTVLDVWTGASLAALTLVVTNDDAGTEPNNPATSGRTSQVTFTPTSGVTYWLRVNGWAPGQEGSIVLSWHTPPPPGITSFAPTHAHIGALVTITGLGFTGTSDVQFDGTSTSFTEISDTTVTATVPLGATSGTITLVSTAGTFTSATSFTVDPPGIDTLRPSNPVPGTLISARGGGLSSATGAATVAGTTADNVVIGRDDRVLVETPNDPGATGPVAVTTGSYGDLTGPDVTIGPLGTPPGRARLFVSYGTGAFGDPGEVLWEVGAGEYDVVSLDTDIREPSSGSDRLGPSLDRSFLIWSQITVPVYGGGNRLIAQRVDTDGTVGTTYDPSALTLSRTVLCGGETTEGVVTVSNYVAAASHTADDLRPWVTTYDPSSGAVLDQYVDPDQLDNMVGALAVTPAGDAYVTAFDSGSGLIQVIRINPSAYGTVVNTLPTTGGWGPVGISRYADRVAVMRGLSSSHADVWDVPVDGSTPHQLFEVVISGDVIGFSGGAQTFHGFDHDDGGKFWLWSSNGLSTFVWVIDAGGNGADDPLMFFDHDLDSLCVIGGTTGGWLIGSVGY